MARGEKRRQRDLDEDELVECLSGLTLEKLLNGRPLRDLVEHVFHEIAPVGTIIDAEEQTLELVFRGTRYSRMHLHVTERGAEALERRRHLVRRLGM